MKFKTFSIISVLSLLLLWGCELDNYEAPNATIKGKVIDSMTGKPLTSVQPKGYKIRLIQLSEKYKNPVPIDFWGKANGTFKNTALFEGKYKVKPIIGAFFEPEAKIVKLKEGGVTTVTFTVTPFLEIKNVSVTPFHQNGAIVKYQIDKAANSNKILTSETIASLYPAVNHVVFKEKVENDLSNIPDNTIVNTVFSDTLTGLVPNHLGGVLHNTYYIRVAAKAKNPNNEYNYSKLFKITVQ